MADASFVQSAFHGGEWSKSMQGRIDRPDYRTAMNVCLNGIPLDTGAWTRRPGSRYGATTRRALSGRVMSLSFEENSPYTLEFTDGFLRSYENYNLAMTNDAVAIASISTATPAVVTTATPHGWSSNDYVMFSNLGGNNAPLHNRQFKATVIDATRFSIASGIMDVAIDGSTLGTFISGTVSRIAELQTPYAAGSWATVRSVQAETDAVLLAGTVPPQHLEVITPPADGTFAEFELNPVVFQDGPYYDPVPGGALVTPSGTTGIITLTLSFSAWSATKVYSKDDYATTASVTYKSLIDQNLNRAPASSPAAWEATPASTAINGGDGFKATDVGRHVRLLSEPSEWAIGTTYTAGQEVVYADVAWKALTTTTGDRPGSDTTHWGIDPVASVWTWGRITGLLNKIDGALAGSVAIGDMAVGTPLSTAFDGIFVKSSATALGNVFSGAYPHTTTGYIGKNYSGASAQKISSATIYPTTNLGVAAYANDTPSGLFPSTSNLGIELRASMSAPASATDGTLLGSFAEIRGSATLDAVNIYGPSGISIASNDTTTAWNYVWLYMFLHVDGYGGARTGNVAVFATQVEFFNPDGASGNGVSLELLGGDLAASSTIRTWRLGLFSGTTGYPTNGTYHEGRLWLSGVEKNRIDGSKSNDLFNFAPTELTGTVTDANAVDYTFNAPDTNPIFWMTPDQQGILAGTQAGEWLISAAAPGAMSPTNIKAARVTKIGCANIEPKRTDHTTVFVQRYQHKVMEYFADVYSGKFSAPNLSVTAKHLTARVVEEIAYQQELSPVIWARCADGSLIGCSYKRDTLASSQGPTFAGWHSHTLGSGRTVDSICTGPSTDGLLDTLAMVTVDGSGVHHVEFLTNLWEEGSALTTGWFLDDAIVPTSYAVVDSTLVMQGLWALNASTVTVFAGGVDCGEAIVADGTATVDLTATLTSSLIASFAGAMPIVVGFSYNSDGQIVRPATPQESGARNGPAMGKKRRVEQYGALLVDAQSISFGTAFTTSRLKRAKLASAGQTAIAATALYSGTHWDSLEDDYSFDGMICWRIARPFPATVSAISGFLQTQDR